MLNSHSCTQLILTFSYTDWPSFSSILTIVQQEVYIISTDSCQQRSQLQTKRTISTVFFLNGSGVT